MKYPLLIVILLVLVSAGAVVWASRNMEEQISRRVAGSMETVLNTTQGALRLWKEQAISNAATIADWDELRSAVNSQLQSRPAYSNLVQTPGLRRLRRLLGPFVEQNGYIDFAVIGSGGVQIASGLDDFLGQDSIAKLNSHTLAQVFSGAAQLGMPFQLPTGRRNNSDIHINMLVAAPVFDETNRPIAALLFRFDPNLQFSQITQLGWLGRTGETYVFDKQARLLTRSRFEQDELRFLPPHRSALFMKLRDPGVDTTEGFRSGIPQERQPLTRMAQAATESHSGIDLAGYRDYRGVRVVGAWVWDDELGLGVATEMDEGEAKAPIQTIWYLSFTMLAVVAAAIVLLMRLMAHRARLLAVNFGYHQALKARQDLLAIVAHDLKNPITSVALSSSVLMAKLQAPDPEIGRVIDHLGIIHRSSVRMNRLIEDLLVSTTIESGQLRVRRQDTDLARLLQEFEKGVVPLMQEKAIRFTYSIDPKVPHIFVDPDRLTQVLSNVVGNAIKYSPRHGMIALSVDGPNDEVEFRIRDSGPGIPSNELPRIFERYWQARHRKDGAGLGLYISKGLVEAHGGRIWVESEVGKGTTVCFRVPQSQTLRLQTAARRTS